MAQLDLTFDQHVALLALLKHSDVQPYVNHDPGLKEVLDGLEGLSFKVRTCPVCDTEFEVMNPRKKTCSDACRQALSRSKYDPMAIRKRQFTLEREAFLEAIHKRNGAAQHDFSKYQRPVVD
jgi:predicted nucleic acid-binding Zn ribbon protein